MVVKVDLRGKNKYLKKFIKADRTKQVIKYRMEGWTYNEISQATDLNEAQISDIIEKAFQEVRAEYNVDSDKLITKEVGRLEHLYEEAMEAWHRSCENAEFRKEVTEKGRPFGKGNKGKKLVILRQTLEEAEKGQAGERAFLAEARECRNQIEKLLGLIKPANLNLQQNNVVVGSVDWGSMLEVEKPVVDEVTEKIKMLLEDKSGGSNNREGTQLPDNIIEAEVIEPTNAQKGITNAQQQEEPSNGDGKRTQTNGDSQ
jgi:hypothetical protein